MGFLSTNDSRGKLFVWVGLPLWVVGGVLSAIGLPSAWQASNGGGTPGTFTAVHEECGGRQNTCHWSGTFVAAEGDARRTHVKLYGAPDGLAVGVTVPARDTGASSGVFSTSGSSRHLVLTVFTLVGAAALVAWVKAIMRAIRRRRAQPPTPSTRPWPPPPGSPARARLPTAFGRPKRRAQQQGRPKRWR